MLLLFISRRVTTCSSVVAAITWSEMVSFWHTRELFLVRFKSGEPRNRQTGSVGGGLWVALPDSRQSHPQGIGSKAAKSRSRMQRTQVRIRNQNLNEVYHLSYSHSTSEAVTMPADSFFMLLLMKINFSVQQVAPLPPEEARLAPVKETPKIQLFSLLFWNSTLGSTF